MDPAGRRRGRGPRRPGRRLLAMASSARCPGVRRRPSPGRARVGAEDVKTAVDLDALADLEEQRRFLLQSLKDLDRERDAGDIDGVDYRTLKDDYTARAAAVLH